MTIADRRERDKQQRRDSIVDAAERLFFTKGFPVTTIDEIAEAAELSKGTIYLYFKNKEEIYVAIAQRGMRLLTELTRGAIAAAPTGKDKVRAVGQALLTFYKRHPQHFKALFYQHPVPSCPIPDGEQGGPLIKALIRDGEGLHTLCVEAVRSGIADGSIPPGIDPVRATLVFVSMILGLVRMVAVEERLLLRSFNLSGGPDPDRFRDAGSPPGRSGATDRPEGTLALRAVVPPYPRDRRTTHEPV